MKLVWEGLVKKESIRIYVSDLESIYHYRERKDQFNNIYWERLSGTIYDNELMHSALYSYLSALPSLQSR